ncbi:hypothetical protein ACCO45_009388 [Purpureocillium lilacinum]|uniref:Uncharacterized protein n=1 Tax=Purpureocillium lilacinum TaxID=33203 RepID=A0ACC4DJJ4_PURLI
MLCTRVWLALAFLVAVQVAAIKRGHAFERLFVWEAYNIAWDWKGNKQQYLFPIQRGGKTNKGSGPDGRFTFQEFMNAVENRSPNHQNGLCTVAPPDENNGRTFKIVATELEAAKFNSILQPLLINRRFDSGKPGQKKKFYPELLKWINTMIVEAVQAEGVRDKIQHRLLNMKTLTDIVLSCRDTEFQKRLSDGMIRGVHKGGAGISEDLLRTDPAVTNPFSDEEVKRVNLVQTLALLAPSDRQKVAHWFEQYGTEDWKTKIAQEPVAGQSEKEKRRH